jgi:hypothetical protein
VPEEERRAADMARVRHGDIAVLAALCVVDDQAQQRVQHSATQIPPSSLVTYESQMLKQQVDQLSPRPGFADSVNEARDERRLERAKSQSKELEPEPEPELDDDPFEAEPAVGPSEPWQVFVRRPGGASFGLELAGASETIESLKHKIEQQEGVPATSQRLVFAGHLLEEGRTLGESGLQRRSTVELTVGFGYRLEKRPHDALQHDLLAALHEGQIGAVRRVLRRAASADTR